MPPSFFRVRLPQRTLASSLSNECCTVCLLPCPPRVFPLATLLQHFWLIRGRTLASDGSCLAHAMRAQHPRTSVVLLPCRDPLIALAGFSWDASDEQKARSSFALGRGDFGCFYDVHKIAMQLGYSRFGLGRLCVLILGLDLPKPKHVRPLACKDCPT